MENGGKVSRRVVGLAFVLLGLVSSVSAQPGPKISFRSAGEVFTIS